MMSSPYFLGIDGGTESVRVALFDREGTQVGFANHTYALKHPRPGWAEQDPEEWWSSLVAAFREMMSKSSIAPNEIAGLSLDCTTCTVVALDKYDRRDAHLGRKRAHGEARLPCIASREPRDRVEPAPGEFVLFR